MTKPFPFFLGSARSGTTLIRVMFDSHPEMAIPSESHFVPAYGRVRARYESASGLDAETLLDDLYEHVRFQRWKLPRNRVRAAIGDARDYPEAIRRIYGLIAELKGKTRYGDKTPNYCLFIPEIATLFPEARFVHVIRDGRNTALSIVDAPFGPKRLDQAAVFWRKRVEPALEATKALGPSRVYPYKHEDLIADPPGTLKGICEFLDLPFDEQMLRYYEDRRPSPSPHMQHLTKPPTAGLRDWRTIMSPADVELFERIAGPLLTELGYERATDGEPFTDEELAASVPSFEPAPIRRMREIERKYANAPKRARAKKAAPVTWTDRVRASKTWADLQKRPWGRKATDAALKAARAVRDRQKGS